MTDYSSEIAELKARLADLERRQEEDRQRDNVVAHEDFFQPSFRQKSFNAVTPPDDIINHVYTDSELKRESKFEHDLANLHAAYQAGKIPKINRIERQILEFCHDRDMKQFIKEEFTEHPIVLNEDGSLKYSWYRENRR